MYKRQDGNIAVVVSLEATRENIDAVVAVVNVIASVLHCIQYYHTIGGKLREKWSSNRTFPAGVDWCDVNR